MSTQRKKASPNMGANYFAPIPSTQKKVKKAPIVPKSAGKLTGGIRKVRRTEDLLFWDVEPFLSPEIQVPKSAPSKKSMKSDDTASANVDILLKDCDSSKHNAQDMSKSNSRKIVKAKRRLKQKTVDNEVDDLELHIPIHQIRNMNANVNKEVDKMFTPILTQKQKVSKSSFDLSVDRSLRNRRLSNVWTMTDSLGNTPVPWKNSKTTKSPESNIMTNNISRSTKSADSFNKVELLSSSNKTPKNLNRNKSIPTVSVTNIEHTLNTTYDKVDDYDDDDFDEVFEKKSSSIITIHDSLSFVSPSKSEGATMVFDCSTEQMEPSLTGNVTNSETKRSTFELEQTVHNVSLLKDQACNDSFNMNNFPNNSLQLKSGRNFLNVSSPLRFSRVMTPVGVSVSTPFGRSTPAVQDSASKNLRKNKPVSRVKMPNFAAIHAKALQHVENISDYKKRKETRAQMLLSGKKPLNVKTPDTKRKKQIRFASNIIDKKKSPTYIPLPATPMPIKQKNDSITSEQSFDRDVERPKALLNKLFTSGNHNKENQVLKEENKLNNNNSSKTNSRVISFPRLPNAKIIKPVKKAVPKKDYMKKEEIKTIVASKCNGKLNLDLKTKKRSELAGVRSNRRFDLLMKMRKKDV